MKAILCCLLLIGSLHCLAIDPSWLEYVVFGGEHDARDVSQIIVEQNELDEVTDFTRETAEKVQRELKETGIPGDADGEAVLPFHYKHCETKDWIICAGELAVCSLKCCEGDCVVSLECVLCLGNLYTRCKDCYEYKKLPEWIKDIDILSESKYQF